MTNENSQSSRIGFTVIVEIVFITLKLTGYISWPWWWVLLPIWIIAAIFIFTICFMILTLKKNNET